MRDYEWLIEHSGERGVEFAGLIAEHLERAGRVEQAMDFLLQAGKHAAACYANEEAISYFTRLLALLPESEVEQRFDVLLLRCKVYDHKGDTQARQADLQALGQQVILINEPARHGRLAYQWARFYEKNADYPQALSFVHQAVDSGEKAGDLALQAEAHAWWGYILLMSSEIVAESSKGITREFKQSLELAKEADLTWLVSRCLRGLADSADLFLDDWPQAREYFEQALSVARQARDVYQEAGFCSFS